MEVGFTLCSFGIVYRKKDTLLVLTEGSMMNIKFSHVTLGIRVFTTVLETDQNEGYRHDVLRTYV
jgi:hypothetical protein